MSFYYFSLLGTFLALIAGAFLVVIFRLVWEKGFGRKLTVSDGRNGPTPGEKVTSTPLAFSVDFRILLILACLMAMDVHGQTDAELARTILPGPDLVLRLDAYRNCGECPAYSVALYSDGTYQYEGKDGVFTLGPAGNYYYWKGIREKIADPGSPAAANYLVKLKRDYLRQASAVFGQQSKLKDVQRDIVESGVLSLEQAYPVGLRADSRAHGQVKKLFISLGGHTKDILFVSSEAPEKLVSLWKAILGHLLPGSDLHVNLHAAPPFWSDETALLAVVADLPVCGRNVGMILYNDGRATMYGWHPARGRKDYWQVFDEASKEELARVAAEFERAESNGRQFHPYAKLLRSTYAALPFESTRGSDIARVTRSIFYKPKLGISVNRSIPGVWRIFARLEDAMGKLSNSPEWRGCN